MLPPSSLPDWKQFNVILLDELKAQGLSAVVDDRIRSAVACLTLDDVGVATFSEAIVKIVAGEGYFPVLQVLDSNCSNANHHAIADLARQGIVNAIVTTNFDTLIERAFDEAAVPLRVAVDEKAFSHPSDNGICTLYKVHGSVTDAKTLVDTVGQKVRGLPAFVRFRLADLFASHHVLVVGFSGADLAFGSDYFSFSAANAAGSGLTWGVQLESPTTPLPVHAVDFVKRFGAHAALQEMTLPDVFFQLGAMQHGETMTAASGDHGLAAERARPRIAEVCAGFGARNSLAFCMRLLADAGKTDTAAVLHRALARDIESQPDRKVSGDGPAIRALAHTAALIGDGREATYWHQLNLKHLERQLRAWQRRSRKAEGSAAALPGRNLSDQREFERLLAGAWTNLGEDLLRHGTIGEGGKALERALAYCELSGDLIALADMCEASALWEAAARDPDSALLWGWIAEAAGLATGNVDAANSAALRRAEQSVRVGEYDSALAALDRIRRRKPLGLSREMKVDVERLTGVIEVRRGRPREALATWRQTLEELTASEALAARVRWTMITTLRDHGSFKDALIEEADKLLSALRHPLLSPATTGLPPVEDVEKARRNLVKGHARLPPYFDSWFTADTPDLQRQAEIWQQLVHAEAAADQETVLVCLRLLSQELYRGNKALRTWEVALAHLAAAKRAGNLMEQINAKWVLGHVLASLGDTAGARQNFATVNAVQFVADPLINARAAAQLARLDTDPQPRQPMLEMIDLIEGREKTVRTADDDETLARRTLQTTELGLMRLLTFEALALRRLSDDVDGVSRCYEILADGATAERRLRQAKALRGRARQLRANTASA